MAEGKNWVEMLVGLYDKLAGGGAEISCAFDDFEVVVPRPADPQGEPGRIRISGSIKVGARRRAQS